MARDMLESSVGKFWVSVPQAFHHATQFGEPLQAADIGVARVGFLVDVVGEQMSMIGPHGNFMILSAGAPPARFLTKQCADYAYHIRTAVKMLGFME